MPPEKFNRIIFKYRYVLLGTLLVSALLILFAFDPAHSRLFPPCPFKYLTGLDCPGCGSLRAIHQLLNGNFSAALSFNPPMIIFSFIMLLVLAALLIRNRFTKSFLDFLSRPFVGWVALIVIIAYWLLRNFPFYPFTPLGPN